MALREWLAVLSTRASVMRDSYPTVWMCGRTRMPACRPNLSAEAVQAAANSALSPLLARLIPCEVAHAARCRKYLTGISSAGAPNQLPSLPWLQIAEGLSARGCQDWCSLREANGCPLQFNFRFFTTSGLKSRDCVVVAALPDSLGFCASVPTHQHTLQRPQHLEAAGYCAQCPSSS